MKLITLPRAIDKITVASPPKKWSIIGRLVSYVEQPQQQTTQGQGIQLRAIHTIPTVKKSTPAITSMVRAISTNQLRAIRPRSL